MRSEFRLLAQLFKTYMPPVYPFDVVGGRREVKQTDFDDRVDVLPVADPNIFSMAQTSYTRTNRITTSYI